MDTGPVLVWFRQDLRLSDHPALAAATQIGVPVVPVFVLDENGPWQLGGASRWWLHHSLARLEESITAVGGRLVLRKGGAARELVQLASEIGASAVLWNRRYEPHEKEREISVERALRDMGIGARSSPGNLLFEPGSVRTQAGEDFRIFSAFWRAALSSACPARPLPAPEHITAPATPISSIPLESFGLLPTTSWWREIAETWVPGEKSATGRLAVFLKDDLDLYRVRRDQPAAEGTSHLSPHLAFGEISPRQIWHAAQARENSEGAEAFLRELGWREFSYSLLASHPDLPSRPMKPEFNDFAWHPDESTLDAWRTGRTGFPIIDAGMRQLWRTGWMHNRVRMIVASFLVKDLLSPWQVGEEWFWDTLVDADLAVNAASWQWVAGTGIDAAPYFRIFNPVLQGEKFDPRGHYVRRWVPELAGLPDLTIHRPWNTSAETLAACGVKLGHDYPFPIVDHGGARRRALLAYNRVKKPR